jgi:hypothetical protein
VQEGAGKSQADGRRGRIEPDSILRAESWRGNGDPAEPGEAGAGRVKSGTSKEAKNATGIRSFRAYAQRRLAKFRGVPGTTFILHRRHDLFQLTPLGLFYRLLFFGRRRRKKYLRINTSERRAGPPRVATPIPFGPNTFFQTSMAGMIRSHCKVE